MILGYKKLFPWKKPTEFDQKIIHGHKSILSVKTNVTDGMQDVE